MLLYKHIYKSIKHRLFIIMINIKKIEEDKVNHTLNVTVTVDPTA